MGQADDVMRSSSSGTEQGCCCRFAVGSKLKLALIMNEKMWAPVWAAMAASPDSGAGAGGVVRAIPVRAVRAAFTRPHLLVRLVWSFTRRDKTTTRSMVLTWEVGRTDYLPTQQFVGPTGMVLCGRIKSVASRVLSWEAVSTASVTPPLRDRGHAGGSQHRLRYASVTR